jgi:hypothetical protein
VCDDNDDDDDGYEMLVFTRLKGITFAGTEVELDDCDDSDDAFMICVERVEYCSR